MLTFSLFLISCEDLNNNSGLGETDINDWYTVDVDKQNCPVTAKAPGSFTFVLDGKKYDYESQETVDFNYEDIAVSLTVTNASNGDGLLTIRDEEGSILYTKNINGNMIIVEQIKLADIPNKVDISLDEFSGKISFVFAENLE